MQDSALGSQGNTWVSYMKSMGSLPFMSPALRTSCLVGRKFLANVFGWNYYKAWIFKGNASKEFYLFMQMICFVFLGVNLPENIVAESFPTQQVKATSWNCF